MAAVPERRTSMKIWTDDECIEVDPNDVGQLEAAMLFKAEHIKAKADPEMFSAVADMLSRLWDSATKRVEVVRCKDCARCITYRGVTFCNKWRTFPEVELDGFCSYAERKEGADNG